MATKEPLTCEYLSENRLCKAVTEFPEGKEVRQKFCSNSPKNYCCYLCSNRENCEISCSFLENPKESVSSDKSVYFKIDQQIKRYQEEMNKLSILLANGKIGEKSFLAATKTLKQKIVELKKTKENPDLSSTSSTASSEWNESDESANQLEKPSALWYLVPFLFGIIGGIVGYLGTKERDKGTADSLLIFGVVWTVILVIFYWVILAALFSQL